MVLLNPMVHYGTGTTPTSGPFYLARELPQQEKNTL